MPRITILNAGRDRTLLFTRTRVLEEAGYIVTPAITPGEITEQFFRGDFDVIILCHSIPQEERERIAKLVRMQSPSSPVIALADLPTRKYDFGDLTVDSDAANLLRAIPEGLAIAAQRKPAAPAHVSGPPSRPRRSA
jgi:hypothetical protein